MLAHLFIRPISLKDRFCYQATPCACVPLLLCYSHCFGRNQSAENSYQCPPKQVIPLLRLNRPKATRPRPIRLSRHACLDRTANRHAPISASRQRAMLFASLLCTTLSKTVPIHDLHPLL
jgi:hypothetical protein